PGTALGEAIPTPRRGVPNEANPPVVTVPDVAAESPAAEIPSAAPNPTEEPSAASAEPGPVPAAPLPGDSLDGAGSPPGGNRDICLGPGCPGRPRAHYVEGDHSGERQAYCAGWKFIIKYVFGNHILPE